MRQLIHIFMKSLNKKRALLVTFHILLIVFLLFSNFTIKAYMTVLIGAAFFHLSWYLVSRYWACYFTINDVKEEEAKTSAPGWSWTVMVALTIIIGILMVNTAFRGAEDNRMIWTFHEDEGWIADLYEAYLCQSVFDLGENWGYTYGSLNLMTVTVLVRVLRPIVRLKAEDCVIINRLLLVAALIGTGWIVFFIGIRACNSPPLGVAAAGLLLTNVKIIEMSVLSNYPDVFHMFFLTLAVYFSARMLQWFRCRDTFLAVLFTGIGFSVKYMGLPLLLIITLIFAYKGKKAFKHEKPKSKGLSLRHYAQSSIFMAHSFLFSIWSILSIIIAFFTINPYYIVHYSRFMHQMSLISSVYGKPWTMNHLPQSTADLPGLREWLIVGVSGGTPDAMLFWGVLLTGLCVIVTIRKNRCIASFRDSFVLVASAFLVSWAGFVVWRSKFAFFHYFLPIMPCAYILSCSVPLYLSNLIKSKIIRNTAIAFSVSVFFLALTAPLIDDIFLLAKRPPFFGTVLQRYARYNKTLQSRFYLSYAFLAAIRDKNPDNIPFVVGRWLNEHCKDARFLVTNETNFYYPTYIKDVKYLNRQLNLDVIFRSMPDLIIVSDWYIDMYTKGYSIEEIRNMPEDERSLFLQEREFYSLIKDKDEFLNYRRINIFESPPGWYWKRLHIYKREGPRNFSQMLKYVKGLTLMPPPNGIDILSKDDSILPCNFYLAAKANNPVPSTLEIGLKSPIEIENIGFAWYSSQNRIEKASVKGLCGNTVIFDSSLPVSSPDGTPYSWIPARGRIDRIILKVDSFKGQQRLLLKRIFIKTPANPKKDEG